MYYVFSYIYMDNAPINFMWGETRWVCYDKQDRPYFFLNLVCEINSILINCVLQILQSSSIKLFFFSTLCTAHMIFIHRKRLS